ncbi:MAG: radical SAM protein [Deltaproteobacteria bacterium]|nr:radical SAM protein [Deltaproteobacteria bacterium]
MARWLFDLLKPHGLGSEVLPGIVLKRASEELGLRLTFAMDGTDLHVDVGPADDATPHAARSDRLVFGYRVGRGEVDAERALALCRRLAELARANEAEVLAALAEDSDRGRIRHVETEQLLEPMGGGDERFYGLSPYVGCLIGCRFCYAPSRLDPLRRLLGLDPIRWGSWTDVRTNAPAVLADELRSRPAAPIKLCPIVSDPYHAVESKEELTRRCLEVLVEHAPDWPLFVLTRSPLVRRDFDLLTRLDRAWVGVSLPTADDAVRAHFEPRASSVAERLETLALARQAGLRTFAMVQPILPGSVTAMVDALATHADSVSLDVLRGVQGAADDFADHAEAATDEWQIQRSNEIRRALNERGVPLWSGELPPDR